MVRNMLKAFVLVCAVPFYVLHRLEALALGRERSFAGMTQLLALLPGVYGVLLRVAFLRLALHGCTPACVVEFMTTFVTPRTVIGRNVYIGAYCNIGHADIGDDSLLGTHVMVTSGKQTHFFDDPDVPIRLQGGRDECVRIGRDCWIGNGAIVMADVGDGCVVAAGSVVAEALPPYSIAAGIPARVLGRRGERRGREAA